jgi:hypothetical protein
MAFFSSALLVEGEGDRAFYETLRRRMARSVGDGRIDQLTVVPVGSKAAFAPWLRILSSYGTEGDRPIRWLLVAYGDAATQVRRAHQDAGLRLRATLRAALMSAANERDNDDQSVFVAATEEVNRRARQQSAALHLSPVDLEHAVLLGCSDDQAAEIAEALGLQASDRGALEVALRNRKAAYRRAALANEMPWASLSDDTRTILRRWLDPVMPRGGAARAIRAVA